jgi:hypothetical protein
MLSGMKESYKKGESESILALSLAAGVVRHQSKRRQGYRWAGLLSFEKRLNGVPTLSREGEGNMRDRAIASDPSAPRSL